MIDCLHNQSVCLLCVEDEGLFLRAQMMLLNPKQYPDVLGTQQALTIPKDVGAGEWHVRIPRIDESGNRIEDQHTNVVLLKTDA